MPETLSSSSRASNAGSKDPEALEPWASRGHALSCIVNRKLPAAYESLAELRFYDESLRLHLDSRELELQSEQADRARSVVRSLVRSGRVLSESDPVRWTSGEGIKVERTIRLLRHDRSRVQLALRFVVTNERTDEKPVRPSLQWQLVLPSSEPFVYMDGQDHPLDMETLGDSEQRDLSLRERKDGQLVFSLDSQRLVTKNNRLLTLGFDGRKPYRVSLYRDGEGRQCVTAHFTADLRPKAELRFTVELGYEILLEDKMSDTVLLVARPEEGEERCAPWQGALAAAMTWLDRLEVPQGGSLPGLCFRRFAPFLWFDTGRPLPDQVLRFLHSMISLRRIIVFGQVQRHDLENLLTALLDKGAGHLLRLQVFTDDDYYRDQVNVLRGNIQARMIIADESQERVRRLEEVVSVIVEPVADLLPLSFRRFMQEEDPDELFGDLPVRDTSVFLVSAAGREAPLLAAAAVPMARHLAAPVLLWSRQTARKTLEHLKQQQVQQIFLVGRFEDVDVEAIKGVVCAHGDMQGDALVRIPYQDPVVAAAVLARLFKTHLLLDWVMQSLGAEQRRVTARIRGDTPIADLTRGYVERIGDRPWAREMKDAMDRLLKGDELTARDLLPMYQDTFIGREEFLSSFQEHVAQTIEAALERADTEVPQLLAPLWNDMVVLCDFDANTHSHASFFTASCFAAFHEAPLLLFPAVSQEAESFLEENLKLLVGRLAEVRSRNLRPEQAIEDTYLKAVKGPSQDLTRLVFPSDVRRALRSLHPLNIALYSTDVRVPYEALSDEYGPIFLNYVLGHLSGTDLYETGLITASGMLYRHELQQQDPLRTLICLVNLKQAPLAMLQEEGEKIRNILENGRFHVQILSHPPLDNQPDASKAAVLENLAGNIQLFHFSGHGIERKDQPQRSGIMFEREENVADPLNALEIKYHTKLGAHPLVFLNGCFAGSMARQKHPEDEPASNQETASEDKSSGLTEEGVTTESGRYVMGISSSFIHVGAAAVVAPRWVVYEDTAVLYAGYFYEYLRQGCSIGEAACLARIDCMHDMQPPTEGKTKPKARPDYHSVLSYVIWGDPTLRLYAVHHLIKHHPETVRKLLRLKSPGQREEGR